MRLYCLPHGIEQFLLSLHKFADNDILSVEPAEVETIGDHLPVFCNNIKNVALHRALCAIVELFLS